MECDLAYFDLLVFARELAERCRAECGVLKESDFKTGSVLGVRGWPNWSLHMYDYS